MNITADIAAKLLAEYGISSIIEAVSSCRSTDGKTILKIDVEARPPLVLKLFDSASRGWETTERQCVFIEHLRRNGIPTPEHYSRGGEYCLERNVLGNRVFVTLEDFCGETPERLDEVLARSAGELMARIHRISFRDNFKIGKPCESRAAAGFRAAYDKFVRLAKLAEDSQIKSVRYPHRLVRKPELFGEIIDIYKRRIAALDDIGGRLPHGAVHGDFSLNNFTLGQGAYVGRLTLFGFDSAGDDMLLSDMLLTGLSLAYDSPVDEGVDRTCMFAAFLDGYRSVCPLTHDEKVAACELFPAYNALSLSRISICGTNNPDSLEAIMLSGENCDAADRKLEEIYSLITADARQLFASELFTKD